MKKVSIDSIFEAKPAAMPGAHAPAGFISTEYDESIVAAEIRNLENLESLNKTSLESYKFLKLKETLANAGKFVPYWRNLFKELSFDPLAITCINDLAHLPFLEKEMIKENFEQFISEKVDFEKITYMTTGGSTGSPLKILMNKEVRSKSHAATRYYLKKAGITPGEERGIRLHGNKIPDEITKEGKYWITEGNRLTMSVADINPQTCLDYMEAIKDFKPTYIHAYASALSLLCDYAKHQDIKFPSSIKSIFCDSETLYKWQKDLILSLTNAKIYNIYGHTEAAGMAITFPESSDLESIPIGIMEILDKDGNPIQEAGQEGEIVVTGFNNDIMPFIRYKTYDIAELSENNRNNNRAFSPVLSTVSGRIQDYLVGNDSSLVPAAPLLFDYNFDWTGIDLFQVFQEEKGKLIFKIVTNNSINPDKDLLKKRIIKSFSQIFGDKFTVRVNICKTIPVTNRGKYRYVDQKLRVDLQAL